MSKRRLLDTNMVIRHLVQDNEKHAKAAGKLFDACDRGELTLVLLPAVLAECVFVLESFYEHPRANIVLVLRALISSPGVEMAEFDAHMDALKRFALTKVHFVDCLLAAHAAGMNLPIATFDSDFRKFPDVRVEVD
jgi:predicted nucleic acid-binding protein